LTDIQSQAELLIINNFITKVKNDRVKEAQSAQNSPERPFTKPAQPNARKDSVISTATSVPSVPTADFTFRSHRPSSNFTAYPTTSGQGGSVGNTSPSQATDNTAGSINLNASYGDLGIVYPFAQESAMRSTLLPGAPAAPAAAAPYSTKNLKGTSRLPRCNPNQHDPNNHVPGMKIFDENHDMICVQWFYAAEREYARTRYETVAEEKARLMRERAMW